MKSENLKGKTKDFQIMAALFEREAKSASPSNAQTKAQYFVRLGDFPWPSSLAPNPNPEGPKPRPPNVSISGRLISRP